jgi:hypothetical protein
MQALAIHLAATMYEDLENNSVPYLIGSPHSKIDTQLLGSQIHRRVTLPADFCLASQNSIASKDSLDLGPWCLRKPLWLLPVCCRKEAGKGRKSPENSARKPLNLMESI